MNEVRHRSGAILFKADDVDIENDKKFSSHEERISKLEKEIKQLKSKLKEVSNPSK